MDRSPQWLPQAVSDAKITLDVATVAGNERKGTFMYLYITQIVILTSCGLLGRSPLPMSDILDVAISES